MSKIITSIGLLFDIAGVSLISIDIFIKYKKAFGYNFYNREQFVEEDGSLTRYT
jgi:hypothetical protein